MSSSSLLLTDQVSIKKIIAKKSDPALRNLLITQSYHDLAKGLSNALGQENTNWCHFACWASKTAGTYIRNEEIPGMFRTMITKSKSYKATVEGLESHIQGIHPKLETIGIMELPSTITADVSVQITLGNLKVYSELAPVFSMMIEKFNPSRKVDLDSLNSILVTLKEGDTASGGQQLLREAVSNYFRALSLNDPIEKAQLLLLANGQVGLHEQIRLQPYIKGSLDAPVADNIQELHQNLAASAHKSLKGRILSALDHMIHPMEGELQILWEKMATKVLMTLKVPGQTLHLGRPLPPPIGKPLYPMPLHKIQNQELKNILMAYNALNVGRQEVLARDWARLNQRMTYIFNLFRSRQQVPSMFNQPFNKAQRLDILGGIN